MLGKLPRYRDKASQFFPRPHNHANAEAVEGDAGRSTQSEPEQEPTAEDEVGGGPEKDESEDEGEVPLPIDEQEIPDPSRTHCDAQSGDLPKEVGREVATAFKGTAREVFETQSRSKTCASAVERLPVCSI